MILNLFLLFLEILGKLSAVAEFRLLVGPNRFILIFLQRCLRFCQGVFCLFHTLCQVMLGRILKFICHLYLIVLSFLQHFILLLETADVDGLLGANLLRVLFLSCFYCLRVERGFILSSLALLLVVVSVVLLIFILSVFHLSR